MSTEAETTSATGTVATPTKVAPAAEGGSGPTTPSKETDEARQQLVQGRRHLLVKDYFSAAAALAKGCELLAQKFGDTAPELGDAYLTYGRALLELARSESGVLGMNEEAETGADEDDDEDGDGEEGDEDDAEEEEKDAESKENGKEAEAKENGKEAEAKENGKEAEAKEEGAEAKEKGAEAEAKENGVVAESKENGAEAKNGADSEATNGKEETNGAVDADQTLKDDEEEDVNNLQLAWEILELAKGIFQKQIEDEKESKQSCLKLAEVHLKLGEVGVESENYTTAVEDMKACLELQRKYLDEDDRRIAETLYTMGVAYSLANEFDSAIEQFKLASEQIEKRIANLEKKKSEPVAEKSETDDPSYTVQGEIDELKGLLPEMKEKISDMQDFKKETVRRMMDGLAEASAKQSSTADGAGPSTATASEKPVSSVAHLVKRKPKEEIKEESPAAEKMETEETSPSKSTEEKTEKVESEEKAAEERKRKPEDAEEVEDKAKKAKVDESAESKPSE